MFKATFALGLSMLLTVAGAAQTITTNSCLAAGKYTLCQNLWGASTGVGSQSSTLFSTSGDTVSWQTNWTWANNPSDVKSYANLIHNTAKGMQLSAIQSAPTTWDWTYVSKSQDIHADVSYDIWLGEAQSGNPASSASSFEVMIWLSGLGGVQPIGYLINSGVSIAGHTWNLWKGPNSNWQVYSFVLASGEVTNFSADLNEFFQYLVKDHPVNSSLYLQDIQAGTEAFTGSASLLTKSFGVSVSV